MDRSERCPAGTGAYTWREGDTLAAVAARYGVGEGDLRAINAGRDFTPGEEICVPAARCPQGSLYIVHRGDTFTSIAGAFGISVEALSRANPFVEPDAMAIGQVLCVPAPEVEEPPAEADGSAGETGLSGENAPGNGGVLGSGGRDADDDWDDDDDRRRGNADGAAVSCPEGYARAIVREGESYTDLLLANDVAYLALRAANPGLVPGRLRAGQAYCVPPAGTIPGCPLCTRRTTVGAGEDLQALAARLGVSAGALLRRNPALAPSDFTPGRVVFYG